MALVPWGVRGLYEAPTRSSVRRGHPRWVVSPHARKAPCGSRPWLPFSSSFYCSRRGARLSVRPRLHRQGGRRRAVAFLRMRQQLVREIPRLGRRWSVPHRVYLVDPLQAGCRGPWLFLIILVDAQMVGVDSCVGFSGAVVGIGASRREGLVLTSTRVPLEL